VLRAPFTKFVEVEVTPGGWGQAGGAPDVGAAGVSRAAGDARVEVLLKNGHMANNQMTNYIMPTAADVPPIHVYFEEIPFRYGGFGAKGLGELPHDGPAPAILNAIRDATGVSFNSIPLLPEDLYAGLAASQPVEEPALP